MNEAISPADTTKGGGRRSRRSYTILEFVAVPKVGAKPVRRIWGLRLSRKPDTFGL